jgi:predicted amidohydrolase
MRDDGLVAVVGVATCQFPVSSDIGANLVWIKKQMTAAAQRGAQVAHFPEAALSGYTGVDVDSFDGMDWDRLRGCTLDVADHCLRLGIWTVLGFAHPLSEGHKPHNSLYVIDDRGVIVERYDKRFCGGDAHGRNGDLAHYSPGDHPSVWTIDGVRCAALICYDFRFPELHRQYKSLGVQMVFHSFHAANLTPERIDEIGARIGPSLQRVNRAATHTYPGITMPAAMTAAASANHMWISCPNSSARQSCWPSFFVRADGVTTGRLRRNVAGVPVSRIDTNEDLYDSTAAWRNRALAGTLHSGSVAHDPRSDDRTTI